MQPRLCHMEPAWKLSSSLNTFSLWGASQAITGGGRGAGGSSGESGQAKAVKGAEADGNKQHMRSITLPPSTRTTLFFSSQTKAGDEILTVI